MFDGVLHKCLRDILGVNSELDEELESTATKQVNQIKLIAKKEQA